MSYIYRQPYPNELWHHGVQGQKWGVLHGPPYPLYEGHGKSKAVMESKAKYAPAGSSFAIKRQEKGHHTKFERQMARKETKAIKKANKYAEKSENAKSERKQEKFARKESKAKAIADNIASKGTKYYQLDSKEQKKISRGYAWIKGISTARMLLSDSEKYNVVDKAFVDRSAEARAFRRIDEAYLRKKK